MALTVAGCARQEAARAEPAVCGSPAAGAVRVDAGLRAGRAEPAPHRVEVAEGGTVQLGVSADVDAEVHVHGYDLVFPVRPDQPGCVLFVATRSGLFDVEAHPETLLLQIEVR
ncbi:MULTISPECIES: hypothetical protein [Actinoplanes]|uniref:hypothetical protein n=1 Tax=Actinoplanes TaxID=1865 RepID=UPI0012F81AA2|nr:MULTISPECIES: hypothetical protein [Actinoplanes]